MPHSPIRQHDEGQILYHQYAQDHLRCLDHKLGLDQLINIMHRLGICESLKDTIDYKYTYTDSTNSTHAATMAVLGKQTEQHIGNMGYDLITLDGKSGFHAVELIRLTTPENAS